MIRRSLRLLVLSSALVPLFAVQPAWADTNASQKAAAEALFDDGLTLMKANRFAEACPKLEDSQRIDPGIGTLLYLAECYEKLGKTASAWATFREAASNAGAAGQTDREKNAKQRASRLEAKLSYVTLRVPREVSELKGLKVRLGTAELGPGVFGIATPADPGESKLEVSADGHETYSVVLQIEPSKRYDVSIPQLREQPAPVAGVEPTAPTAQTPPTMAATPAPIASAPPPPAEQPSGSSLKTVGLVLGGVGVVGIGVGSFFGLSAISKIHDAKDGSCARSVCQEQADLDKTKDANTAATISNIAFIAGGASLVGGALLFFLAPSQHETGVRAVPYVGSNEVGLTLGGRL
jgi:serine/threonine-protein kinase